MSQKKTRAIMTRRMYQTPGIVILIFGLTRASASGCSGDIAPRMSLAPDSSVLVGHVGDYLAPISMDGCLPGESYPGFTVSVEAVLGGPNARRLRVEIYPYGLSPSCGSRPLQAAELNSRYPPGTRVRVVAESRNPCQGAEAPKPGGTVRLFASVVFGGIAPVLSSDPDPAASEPFDYSGAAPTTERRPGDAVDFEVVKDLMRFTGARTEEERTIILTRLMALPEYRGRGCEELVSANIQVKSEALRLIKTCQVDARELHR